MWIQGNCIRAVEGEKGAYRVDEAGLEAASERRIDRIASVWRHWGGYCNDSKVLVSGYEALCASVLERVF